MALPPATQKAVADNLPQLIFEAGKTVRTGLKLLVAMATRSMECDRLKQAFYDNYTVVMHRYYERSGERRGRVKEIRAQLKNLRKLQMKTFDLIYKTTDPEEKIRLEARYDQIVSDIKEFDKKLEDYSKDEPELNYLNTDHRNS